MLNTHESIQELPQVDPNTSKEHVDDLRYDWQKSSQNLIEDGATLQMGIGAIPDSVMKYVRDRKNLGIHTEMFSDGTNHLVEEGIVNGEEKTIHPEK